MSVRKTGFLRDRDGEPDVILLVMGWVAASAMIAIAFALWQAWGAIGKLNTIPDLKDGTAHATAVATILTASGGFIRDVLTALSMFGLAVAGYMWTDAQNKRAYATQVSTKSQIATTESITTAPAAAPA